MTVATPPVIVEAFAKNGTKNTIPVPSQILVTPGAASFNDGFPPLTMTPIASGGVPFFGADVNGILNMISAHTAWQQGGGQYNYDSTFSSANSGYVLGAVLQSTADPRIFWSNRSAGNTNDPDVTPTNWQNIIGFPRTAREVTAGVTPSDPRYGAPEDRINGNVRRWGCVCDGVTDDTAAFQRAIDSVPNAGGFLYVPASMRLTSTILIENRFGIVLEIAAGSQIIFDQFAGPGLRYKGGNRHVIRGGGIYGTNTGSESITLVRIGESGVGNECPLFRIECVTFAFAAVCLHVQNSYESVFFGNNYSNAFNFLTHGTGSMAGVFYVNETYGSMNRGNATNYGVIIKSPAAQMSNCYWENTSQSQNALNVKTGAQGFECSNCFINNSGGILIETSTALQLSNLRMQDSWDSTNNYGIRIQASSSAQLQNCNLVKSVLTAGVQGILASTANVTISGCMVNKWETGVFSSASGTITGCQILNCTTGCLVNPSLVGSGGAGPCIIDANMFLTNTTGISVNGAARLIKNTYDNNTTNVVQAGTGYIAEIDTGVTASVADGGTITHGHVKTPTNVRACGSVAGEIVTVTALGATTFTVAIKTGAGAPGTTQTIYWDAAG